MLSQLGSELGQASGKFSAVSHKIVCSGSQKWVIQRQSVNSHKAQAQLINILIWRKNTTMPISRIHQYYIVSESKQSNTANSFTKQYQFLSQILPVSINEIIIQSLSQALYLITQMIIGYQAIHYKFRYTDVQSQSCRLNSKGELRINLSSDQQSIKNQRDLQPFQIIKKIFVVIFNLVDIAMLQSLKIYLTLLQRQTNLTYSSAVLLIKETACNKNITIPHNIGCHFSSKQYYENMCHKQIDSKKYLNNISNVGKSRVGHKPLFQSQILINTKNSSFLFDKNSNREQIYGQKKSVCLSEQFLTKKPLSKLHKNNLRQKVNWSYSNSVSSKNIQKKSKRQVSLAYSMIIKPNKIDNQLKQQQGVKQNNLMGYLDHNDGLKLQKLNTKLIPRNLLAQKKSDITSKCFTSYLTSVQDSQWSRSDEYFRNQINSSNIHTFCYENERQKPINHNKQPYIVEQQTESDALSPQRIKNRFQVFGKRDGQKFNCVSMVFDEDFQHKQQAISSIKNAQMNIFTSKQTLHNLDLNESYSACNSPQKNQQYQIRVSPRKQHKTMGLTQILVQQQQNLGQIYQQNGWSNSIKLFSGMQSNMKESLHCGSDSYLPIDKQLMALKLSKLGNMGRLIGTSVMPENGWN